MELATGALGTLLPKLGQLLQDEYNLQKGVKKNIEFLTKELKTVHAALCDVGKVPREDLTDLVKVWADEAREVSYDMEDIVDTFLVRVQDPATLPSKRSAKKFIKQLMGFVTKSKTRHDIGQEIKGIKERVEEIAKRHDRYKVIDAITPVKTVDVDPRITHLYTKAADLVGIDDSRDELITRLTKGDDISLQKQRIVSVVGFGGLGKTTLAKVVYDRLKGQFDHTAFIPVGRNPNLKKVLMDILIDLDKQCKVEILDEKQLIDKLRELLKNKRYFIVIDDVWDKQSWERIKLALVENNNGSRIIITTRKHEVAEEAREVYKLKPLSQENSRKLFFARIFDGKSNSSYHQSDDEVSGKFLKKCEGIPLAIITMDSLLAGKPWEEWSEVYHSIGFANKENQQVENTKKIISYSYYELPSNLRTCLLYLCVFPEDYFIEKSRLISMWIAEGFVDQTQGRSSFEIGEGYFNELVNRSMIQEVDESPYIYESSGCRVHDMVLDLICSISHEENFVTILDNNEGTSSSSSQVRVVRRLALKNYTNWEAPMENMRQVRSFVSFGFDLGKGPRLSRFKLIRVLDIYHIEYCRLKHIRSLHHLRYFKLKGPVNVELPEEIGTLKCLQTLDVGAVLVGKVATSVCLLGTQLLCLRLRSSISILSTDGISKMTSLEELRISFGYAAGTNKEEELKRFFKELGSLRKLRMLDFDCHHPWSTEVQINLVECLRSLEKMEVLSLSVLFENFVDTATWDAAGFLLPRRLRQLFLHSIIFSRFPLVSVNRERLPYLSHLCLHLDNIDEQDLRIPGGLPELRFLWLRVHSTLEVTCNTNEELQVCNTTSCTAGDGYLFKKLRRCSLQYQELRLLPSKEHSSGGVSFGMKDAGASVLLDSEWEGVSSGKGLVPTMIPRTHELKFTVVSVQDFIDENHGASLCLEYFASLQHIRVCVYIRSGSDAEVEEVKAALRHAAKVHPNRPTIYVEDYNMGERNDVSAAQDQEVQEAGTSEEN